MTPRDRERFPAAPAVLTDGTLELIRPLRTSDTQPLGDFYLSVPAQDYRFYHNGPLTREHAEAMAATAESPLAPCRLQTDPSQESLDHATNLPLPQHPSFALISLVTFAQFETGNRYWTVLPIPLDFAVACEAIAKNGQAVPDHCAVPALQRLAEHLRSAVESSQSTVY